MINVPFTSENVPQAQAESAVLRADAQSKNKTLTKAQRQRAALIKKDAIAHAAKLAAVALLFVVPLLSSSAIASEWKPNADRGSATATISGGRR